MRPDLGDRIRFHSATRIREEISQAVPLYAGIEKLAHEGESFQWGGKRLYADGTFATGDGKARFSAVEAKDRRLPPDMFYVSTRRGKQFNSMVQKEVDPLTGASRHSVLISRQDAERLGVCNGDKIRLTSKNGAYTGVAWIDQIKPGNLQVHWPEGNCLLSREEIDLASHEPDYNAVVTIQKSATAAGGV